jgi:hypothetical protein
MRRGGGGSGSGRAWNITGKLHVAAEGKSVEVPVTAGQQSTRVHESSILYEYQSTVICAIAAIKTANMVAKRATEQMLSFLYVKYAILLS